MELFQKLGSEIDALWLEQNYNEEHFPAIAKAALTRADLPSKVSAWDVVEWALKEYELPRQRDLPGNFADPPITIFSGLRFQIDVYFWFEGTTATHQHAFCGAFQVLLGSSIHSWYEFETEEVINTFCELGEMKLNVCELLSVGDVQEIWAGKKYVHALFHLDQPSATIVVRTDRSPLHLPQLAYNKPNFAIDPFFEQGTFTKKLQVMATLIRARRPDADEIISAWLKTCDLQTSYNILIQLRHLLKGNSLGELFNPGGSQDRFQKFLSIVAERHGRAGEALYGVFERIDIRDEIMERRGYVTDPEQRFFMALLLNVDGRERILSLVKHRFPDADPIEKVLDWTFDLAQTRVFGIEASNALGIPDFGENEMFVLEQFLNGKNVDETRSAFLAEHSETEGIDNAIERVQNAVVFRPLLA